MDHSNDQVSKPMTSASDTRVVNESSSQEDQDSRNIIIATTSNQAPSSQAEGTSTAMVAATSNQASSNQLQPQSDFPNQPASNPDTIMDAEFQDFLEIVTLPEQTISPRKPSLQPSDLYADSAAEWNMLLAEAHKNLLLTQITQQHYLLQPYSDSLNQLGTSSDSVFYQEPDYSRNIQADSHQAGGESAFQGGENTSPLVMQTQTLSSTSVVSSPQTRTNINSPILFQVFEKMPLKDITSWNSMLDSYASHGKMEEAAKFFESMAEKDLTSSDITIMQKLDNWSWLGAF